MDVEYFRAAYSSPARRSQSVMSSLANSALLILLIATTSSVPGINGDCVFKGLCGGQNPSSPLTPCVAEGSDRKPHELDSETVYHLASFCSDFWYSTGATFCCDQAQVHSLIAALESSVRNSFGVCPSCKFNLARIFCHMHCSPEQHKFVQVVNSTGPEATNAIASEADSGKRTAGNVSFFLENDYLQRTYDSCAGVLTPDRSRFAVDLRCGEFATRCTPEKLISTIGGSLMPQTPVEFLYEAPRGYQLFNYTTAGCSEAPYEGEYPCHCIHCNDLECPVKKYG